MDEGTGNDGEPGHHLRHKITPPVSSLLLRELIHGTLRLLPYGIMIAVKGRERRKLGRAVEHRHWLMICRYVMRMIYYVTVVFHNCNCHCLYQALWPPIWLFRSTAVAPSSKFRPLRIAFLPKRFLMASLVSCRRRSFSNASSSCARSFS